MDNPAAPIPSISPQPAVSSSVETSTHRWLLWLAGGLVMLIIGIAIGVFGVKLLNQSQGQSQLTSTPTPPQSLTPTLTPNPTATWKIYTNDQFKFRFSYPPSWNIEEMSENLLRLYSPRQPGVIYKIEPFELRVTLFSKVSLQQSGVEPTRDILLPYEKILEQKTIDDFYVTVSEFTLTNGYKNLAASIVSPEIEIRMTTYPTSSSYEDIFDQILSTFKFLDQDNEICDLDQEYQNTAVSPISCQCPQGYEWKIISTSFGPCPAGQARDCPQTVQKCLLQN